MTRPTPEIPSIVNGAPMTTAEQRKAATANMVRANSIENDPEITRRLAAGRRRDVKRGWAK